MHTSTKLPVPSPYPDPATRVESVFYLGPLVLLRLKDAAKMRSGEDAHFVLGAPYRIKWFDTDGHAREILIPEGMLTDLTSVPAVFRSLVGRVGPWLEAAVVHDFLTIAWRVVDGSGTLERRRFADDIMWAAMTEAKVGLLRKGLIYAAIRVAALLYYPRHVAPEPWSDFAVDASSPHLGKGVAGADFPSD